MSECSQPFKLLMWKSRTTFFVWHFLLEIIWSKYSIPSNNGPPPLFCTKLYKLHPKFQRLVDQKFLKPSRWSTLGNFKPVPPKSISIQEDIFLSVFACQRFEENSAVWHGGFVKDSPLKSHLQDQQIVQICDNTKVAWEQTLEYIHISRIYWL